MLVCKKERAKKELVDLPRYLTCLFVTFEAAGSNKAWNSQEKELRASGTLHRTDTWANTLSLPAVLAVSRAIWKIVSLPLLLAVRELF